MEHLLPFEILSRRAGQPFTIADARNFAFRLPTYAPAAG